MADVKALPWIAAVILIAVMAWTNPTKFDHYNAIEESAPASALMGQGSLQALEKHYNRLKAFERDHAPSLGTTVGRAPSFVSAYNNYIVFSTLKLSWDAAFDVLAGHFGQAKIANFQPVLTIGFLGKVFVIKGGSLFERRS